MSEQVTSFVKDYVMAEGEDEKAATELKKYLQSEQTSQQLNSVRMDLSNYKTFNGIAAIHCAAKKKHTEILLGLLSPSLQAERIKLLECQSNDGRTALHYAAYDGYSEAIDIMLNSVDDNKRKKLLEKEAFDGITPLHYSSLFGGIEAVKSILTKLTLSDRIALISKQSTSGDTPLHHAANCSDHASIEHILGKIPSKKRLEVLRLQNQHGNTALHCATDNTAMSVSAILKSVLPDDRPALLSIRNADGRTAEQMANQKGNTDSVNCFRELSPKSTKRKLTSNAQGMLVEFSHTGVYRDYLIMIYTFYFSFHDLVFSKISKLRLIWLPDSTNIMSKPA